MNIIFLLLAIVVGCALADQLNHDSSNKQEEQHGKRRKLDRLFVIEEDASLWGRLLEEDATSMSMNTRKGVKEGKGEKSRKNGKSGKKGGSSSKKGTKGGGKKEGGSSKGKQGSGKAEKLKEKDPLKEKKQSKQRRLRN